MRKITKKDLEQDGVITLFKGKPFTGLYPCHFESEWDLIWDRPLRYYKDGKVVISLGRYILIAPELTEEEIGKGMKEIFPNYRGWENLFFSKQQKEWQEIVNLCKNRKSKK